MSFAFHFKFPYSRLVGQRIPQLGHYDGEVAGAVPEDLCISMLIIIIIIIIVFSIATTHV